MVELVSMAEARRQLRLESTDTSRDDEIRDFIDDAAGWVQTYTGHLLEEDEVTETFTGLGLISLRAWPIFQDAIPAVTFVDAEGTTTEIDGARVDASARPARVLLPTAYWGWRSRDQQFSVTIVAGYQSEDQVPRNFRRAMLVLITAYDEDREGGAVFQAAEAAARRLCCQHRRNVL